jgi:Flp pilus assembly protein TadD
VIFNLLGVCLIELHDFSNSEKSFQEAIKMSSTFYEARFNLILCVLRQGNKEKAKKLFDELEREGGDDDLKDRLLNMKRKYFD